MQKKGKKIKEAIETQISKIYETKVPKKVGMQIIITDMNFKMQENELIEELKTQNEILKVSKIELIKTYKSKKLNRTIFNAKLKIYNESYSKLIS